ncbi:tRNA (guanosine(18)-2'-O)-methyltransferase, partial [hydrothermal vent metagenome]
MDFQTKKEFLDFLSGYLTENRRELFDKVIRNRTRHITVVLEDIYQPHNASAVLRSADLTGIQDIHIIEN